MQYFVESWKALEFLLKFYRIQSVITMKAPRHKLWFIAEHMWMSSKCDWWCFFHTNDTQLHVIFLRALPMKKKRERKSSDSRAGASDDDIASVKEERHHGGLLKSGRLLLSDETSAGWRVRRKFSNKITQHSDVFIGDDMLIELRNL